jgi:hypothetical protein
MPFLIKKAKGKDGYYVYGADGKRHSKEPMELEMAKKQMAALNIAHAKKEGVVIAPKKTRKTKSKAVVIAVPTKIEKKEVVIRSPVAKAKKVARAVETAKAVELMSMTGKKGMHSPAGIVAPLVSETTGGGSGLANDAHWMSAVKSGGRKTDY